MPVQKATRHIYNALSKTWTKNEVFIKMEDAHFDSGAMRVCYRMWVHIIINIGSKDGKLDTT